MGEVSNYSLNQYFSQKITIHQDAKQKALAAWQPPVQKILKFVEERNTYYKFDRLLMTGSYYERVKVKNPDEFDLMIEIDKEQLLKQQPGAAVYPENPPLGYSLLRGVSHGWTVFIDATAIKSTISGLVNQAVQNYQYGSFISQKLNGPAVTLKIDNNGKNYAVDLTFAFKVNEWPSAANEWARRCRRGWPSCDLIEEIVKDGCHVVAKKPEIFQGTSKGSFCWRYSFSTAEKKLFQKGFSGDAGTCMKQVLRLLKSLREDYMNYMGPLTSYHLKTIVFYECERFPDPSDWDGSKLAERFKSAVLLLQYFIKNKYLPHYFIQNLNLFGTPKFNDQVFQSLLNGTEMFLVW
ncbi:putative nucleotidyltransferase MAB21L1 [Nematostella vectensis]|uniref:putative nucleotidyltransferase MAB21L1 n=1 Tax=Nematostella vectensis TaxID=45351 RepID=UPI0020774B7F|nr:putative nucleotidyltransferase MAB21L1 [Nematostella vectensis]